MSDLEWLHADNNEQCEWAIKYLFKKQMLENALQRRQANRAFAPITSYEKIELAISHITDAKKQEEFIKTMYGAWRKQKTDAKKKREKKTLQRSYTLSRDAINKLNNLTKTHRFKPHQTIEFLIDREFEYKTDARRADIYTKQNQKKRRPKEITELNKKLKVAEQTLEKHKKESDDKIEKLTEIMDMQLKTKCEYYVLLDGYGLLDDPLSEDQKQESIKKFTELKENTSIILLLE